MRIISLCLLVYVTLIFYSCKNDSNPADISYDMNDDRGTFIVSSPYLNSLCWSADDTEIYYFTDKLCAVNITTKAVRVLDGRVSNTSFDRNLKLSNDGNTIFYINYNGSGVSLYSIGINGAGLKDLINNVRATTIALSPDNNFIAYSSDSIFSINIFHLQDSTNRQYTLIADPISFSPDGTQLMCKYSVNTHSNIYQMNVSNGSSQTVFEITDGNYGDARWEADGFKMLYHPLGYNYNLWNSNTNSNTTVFNLSDVTMYYRGKPALNMGSTSVVFWTGKCLKYNNNLGCDIILMSLYIVNLNNLQNKTLSYFKLAGNTGTSDCFAFSNDGAKIAYGMDAKIYMRILQ